MSAALLARRYAKVACANLAASSAQSLAAELSRCTAEIAAHPALRAVLDNPQLQPFAAGIVAKVMERLEIEGLAARLVRVLVQRRRAGLLPAVVQAVRTLAMERAGQAQARIQTPQALSAAQVAALQALLQQRLGKPVILQQEVDPTLLGGLRAQIGDLILDFSLHHTLAQLREQLAPRSSRAVPTQ